jgi:uncharacterized protein YciI
MKLLKYTICLGSIVILWATFSCSEGVSPLTVNQQEITFDSLLAKEYGADEYGMKKFVMAFLKRGDNTSLDTQSAMALQMEHMSNIERMAEAGQLVLAGPFLGDGEIRGIYIFNVETIAEAEALTNTDPAIQEGVLSMELMEWYGSAGLMGLNELHQKLSKLAITDSE